LGNFKCDFLCIDVGNFKNALEQNKPGQLIKNVLEVIDTCDEYLFYVWFWLFVFDIDVGNNPVYYTD
jgi:hypothetical protein